MKRLLCFPLALFVGGSLAIGGVDKGQPQPLAIDDGVAGPMRAHFEPVSTAGSSITWVAVDTSVNAFGVALWGIKPLAYDPHTGALAVIYRAHPNFGPGGSLWYSTSLNGGVSWSRVGRLNPSTEPLARYPSLTLHNPLNSTNTADVLVPFSAPVLQAGGTGWGRMVFGVDAFGENTAFDQLVPGPGLGSSTQIWSAGDWIHWVSRNADAGHNLWRTQDYTSIPHSIPPTWVNTNFAYFGFEFGGRYRNGASYFASSHRFTGENVLINIGYSKTTDNGATWSSWVKVDDGNPANDYRHIPGIAGTNWHQWYHYAPFINRVGWDFVVDANNRVHFFGVLHDTLTGARAIVEIYETGTGWTAQLVQPNLTTSVVLSYPNAGDVLNQTGHHINASISADGQVMALVWLDAGAQGEVEPDIWFSTRTLGGSWSPPVNLTNTPAYKEIFLHAAPFLRTNSPTSYTMFLGRSYEVGDPPAPEAGNATVWYVGSYTFTLPTGVKEVSGLPESFGLKQNYPNPFNPSTLIPFSLPFTSHVTLKVYDILGREITTLVDRVLPIGNYEAIFDAKELATGVYLSKLEAGGLVDVRKMMIAK